MRAVDSVLLVSTLKTSGGVSGYSVEIMHLMSPSLKDTSAVAGIEAEQ